MQMSYFAIVVSTVEHPYWGQQLNCAAKKEFIGSFFILLFINYFPVLISRETYDEMAFIDRL